MRLSTDVFDAMDAYTNEGLCLSNIIATGGRQGLVAASTPFELSLNIGNNIVEILSLSCRGVTRGGSIIDIEFDSNFNHTWDTRLVFEADNPEQALLLVVKMHPGKWREVNEMLSEACYTFSLVAENSPLDANSLPIGRIVNEYGWRLDETRFVPPCLFVNAHPAYVQLAVRAKTVFDSIGAMCRGAQSCVARHLLSTVWQAADDNRTDIETAGDALTPWQLLDALKKMSAAFIRGCALDDYVTLEDAALFESFASKPLDNSHIFNDLHRGLELCEQIVIKMETVSQMSQPQVVPPLPTEPMVQKSPQPKPRNRWQGLEI